MEDKLKHLEEKLKYLKSRRYNKYLITYEMEEAVNLEENLRGVTEHLRFSIYDSLYDLANGITWSEFNAYQRYSDDTEKLKVALDTLLDLEEMVLNESLSISLEEQTDSLLDRYSYLFWETPEEAKSELVKDLYKIKVDVYDWTGDFGEVRERMWNVIIGLCLTNQLRYIQKWIKYNVLFGAENPDTTKII